MTCHNVAMPGFVRDTDQTDSIFTILERANQIAGTTALDELIERTLDLMIEISGAESGILYLLDETAGELNFAMDRSKQERCSQAGRLTGAARSIAGITLLARQPIVIDDIERDPRWFCTLGKRADPRLKTLLSFPLLLQGEPIGVIQIFNAIRPALQLIQLLCNRMASEIKKAAMLEASERRRQRLQTLIEVIGRIGSTLDRDQLLAMIMDYACTLLNAEASSLFLVDQSTGDLILHISSGLLKDHFGQVRVPAGKGIIGHVVKMGETILVHDVQRDGRHCSTLDQNTGFVTRSILAVPLRTRAIELGAGRGASHERIIGCLEALNKLDGTFDEEDTLLLETLARQAATVLEIATLYADANEMFMDVIKALTTAIDAKDPYTEGHSQRVSNFSVAIAQELGLDAEMIHHIRIGAILHDVGKIGVPDRILRKPGRLSEDEWDEMKKHPAIGEKIMGQVRMLHTELPALAEHHERLDGKGYPKGLKGDEISLMGRIIAVADAFDAITSDRPYRTGMSVEEAFAVLRRGAGSQFDERCVAALIRAYERGQIRTQTEPEQIEDISQEFDILCQNQL